MTGDEYQPQKVVADIVVARGFEIRHGHFLLGLKLTAELRVLALEKLVSAILIDGTMLGGGHEPGTGVVRNARLRPPLEGGDESVLRELFGQTDIADDSSEAGDEPGRVDPPDCVDDPMGIRGGHSRLGACTLPGLV